MISDWSEQLFRSLLFAPGNHARKVAKVGSFGADAVVLDLEDAVALSEKESTRVAVRAALPTYNGVVVLVRINAVQTGLALADLDAIVCPALDGILLPKVEDPADVAEVDARLASLEDREGLAPGTIRLFIQVETATGIQRVDDIARLAPKRTYTLTFGLADFANDIGVDLTPESTELLYARSRVVVAARAAGLPQPTDGPYLLDLRDRDGLIADSQRLRRLGFQGRVVIYPPQVEPANWAFSFFPSEEVAMARRIVEAFEASESSGSASILVDGVFVDYPIYHRARRKLKLHEAAQERNQRREDA